tara:strand:- start:13415 stop:15460 length:2046 start_codon:yes stop_codon:yes gene_type:complete
MNTVKIYLGDLTYDTVTLSTETFPLNIGYVASYCISRFGAAVEITLFKYIEELDRAIHDAPPTILGLSNYCWCERIGLEMFHMLSLQNPHALAVWGGPNFPLDLPGQDEFMSQRPEVDVYVPVEGETGFSNIVARVLEAGSEEEVREVVLAKPIDSCVTKGLDGKLQYGIPGSRIRDLDQIPSPYLTGLLDKFFDGRLSPIIQTNRGCPFTCTYCVDGTDLVKQVNKFSLERVTAELNYIAERVPESTRSLSVSDLNFGMIPRDLEICDAIAKVQDKYGYPRQVWATTGKNAKDRIISAIKHLNGTLRLVMSVQSTDQHVLRNIRRDNISVDHMLALAPAIKEANLLTTSEVILLLPGDTYESHINTLRDLVRARVSHIQVYTLMLLNGSELNIPQERRKWGLKTKFRILPRDFVELSNGKKVIEVEEVVVGSSTLDFDEYVELRLLAFVLWVITYGIVYDPLLKLLREYDADVFELAHRMVERVDDAPTGIRDLFNSYRQATSDELWASPEAIQAHFQDESEYQKLLNGSAGVNVIQHHHALALAEHMTEWTDYINEIAYDLLKAMQSPDECWSQEFPAVANYCRGLSHNVLGQDRMLTNPEFTFRYDVEQWLNDADGSRLRDYKLSAPSKFVFRLAADQFDLVENQLAVYGDTSFGRSQALKRTPITALWRSPVQLDQL